MKQAPTFNLVIIFLSTKTYVVGTQMNRLNKTDGYENIHNFRLKEFDNLDIYTCQKF